MVIDLTDIFGRGGEHQRIGPTPLQRDFGRLGVKAIQHAFFSPWQEEGLVEDESEDYYEDVQFNIEDKSFNCHKFFFCGRSDYFQALLMGNFRESIDGSKSSWTGLPMVNLSGVSAEAFAFVVDFMYTDNIQNALSLVQKRQQDAENFDTAPEWLLVHEVLQLSDMYMLPVLRNLCVTLLSQYISIDNIFELIATAQLMKLDRLEEACVQFLAINLHHIMELKKDLFANAIRCVCRAESGAQS